MAELFKTCFIIFFLIVTFSACTEQKQQHPAGNEGWLQGSTEEKINVIADQLRGYDMAMVETGYRYQEHYWAGSDKNWGYARYLMEKIVLTNENAFLRRPK